MKRPRRRRMPLAPWPAVCQNCGEPLHCAYCGQPYPLGYWTQEQVDRFQAILESVKAGEQADFAEFFGYPQRRGD